MENTLIDRLPDLKVETLDTTVAEAKADELVDGLTERHLPTLWPTENARHW